MKSLELRYPLSIAGLGLDVWVEPTLDSSVFDDRAHRYTRSTKQVFDERIEVRPLSDLGSKMQTPTLLSAHYNAKQNLVVEGPRLHIEFTPNLQGCYAWIGNDELDFENLLRIWVSRRLLETHGVVLHAAALRHHGYGVAFPGISGAGKSTLTLRHSREEQIAEDMIAVRKDQKTNQWQVDSLPFLAAHRIDVGPVSASLQAISFLRKSPYVAVHRVQPTQARIQLAQTVVAFATLGAEPLILQKIIALSNEVPIFELNLDTQTPFWPALEQQIETHLYPSY